MPIPAERNHVRVFDEQQLIGDLAALSLLRQAPLQFKSFGVSGAPEVAPGHPDFHEHHRDVGSFPGADSALSTKEILTRLSKAVGTPLTPVL